MRKQRLGAFFLLVLLFPGNAAAGPGMLGAAQGAYGNSSDVPKLIVQDICSPNSSRRNSGPRSRRNSGPSLLFTILFPWSAIFGYSPSATIDAARGAYEDSPQGLARLVVDICAAKRAQNHVALDKLFNGLILPNYEAWLVATFGEATGKRMAATYSPRRDEVPVLLSSGFSKLIEWGPTNAEIFSFDLTETRLAGTGTEPAIVLKMLRPTRIYYVRFSSAGGTDTKKQAGLPFVYVEGGFRLCP